MTWANSEPILVFLGLSVLDLCPTLLNAPYPRGGDIIVIADGMLHTSYIVNSAGNSAQVLC